MILGRLDDFILYFLAFSDDAASCGNTLETFTKCLIVNFLFAAITNYHASRCPPTAPVYYLRVSWGSESRHDMAQLVLCLESFKAKIKI